MGRSFKSFIFFSLAFYHFAILPFLLHAQGTWQKIEVPATTFLNAVFFTDSIHGWIAGDSGVILHTPDGGNVWEVQTSGTQNDIVEIFFMDENRGWASSYNFSEPPYGTLILTTNDGGITWTGQPYPEENIFITSILYFDELNGWMGGKPHALVKTSDGGITWQQAFVDTSLLAFFPVLNVKFYNDNIGYASGGMFDIAGVVWRTTNGGTSWTAIDPVYAPADEVHQIHIFDSLHVMGAGGDPDFGYGVAMMHSFDGGITWDYRELGVQGYASDLAFRNEKEAWAPIGPGRKFVYSLDSGETWTAMTTPDSTEIYYLTFPDSLHGYAVGSRGSVLRYKLPVNPGINQVDASPQFSVLSQNHPNPAISMTRIILDIPFEGMVSLEVVDIYGRGIKSVLKEEMKKGRSEVMVNLEDILPGIYIYSITVVDYANGQRHNESKKMVVLR